MATKDAHIAQARHNRDTARTLIEANPMLRDWAIISAFYAAVHYVEACIFDQKPEQHSELVSPNPHLYRIDVMKDFANGKAFASYNRLYQASLKLRYLNVTTSTTTVPALKYYTYEAAKALVEDDLDNICNLLSAAYGISMP